MKTIRLVMGPEDVKAHFRDQELAGSDESGYDKWICVDITAERLLRAAGIAYERSDAYIDSSAEQRIDSEAFRMSGEWYRSYCIERYVFRGIRSESLVRRGFNFFMQGVLRCLCLLDGIDSREGACELVVCPRSKQPGLRLKRGESMLVEWLEQWPDRWRFNVRRIPTDCGARGSGARASDATAQRSQWVGSVLNRWLARSDILIFGNPRLFGSVRRRLKKRGFVCRSVVRWEGFSDLIKAVLRSAALIVEPAAAEALPALTPEERSRITGALSRVFVWDGRDFSRVVEARVLGLYEKQLPYLVSLCMSLERMFKQVRPRVILVDEDVTEWGSAVAEVAGALGIVRIMLVHGVPGKPLGSVPSRSDYILCWGSVDRARLLEWGVDSSKILKLGCPKYDALRLVSDKARIGARKRLGLSPDARVVLIAPTSVPVNALERFKGVISNPYERLRLISNFIRLANDTPECSFVLKFHGSLDDPDIVQNALENTELEHLPVNFNVINNSSAAELIAASDLVVTLYSSIFLESILMGVPVLVVNFSGLPNILPLKEQNILPHAHSYDEIQAACAKLVAHGWSTQDEARRQMSALHPFIGNVDRMSSERVTEFVQECISRQTPSVSAEQAPELVVR